MQKFTEQYPSLEAYWRSIILFGRNVASYKFAMGEALLLLAKEGRSFVPIEDLAQPFALSISRHLLSVDKQGTSPKSKFLDTVRSYNRGEIAPNELNTFTIRYGFQYVLDAFHIVGNTSIPYNFFIDQRKGKGPKGIQLTDELFTLLETPQAENLTAEVEARWCLVERAWEMNIARSLIQIKYDHSSNILYTNKNQNRRVDVTSCRDALNGYQKGSCFYCFKDISIVAGSERLADVDHFFPHVLNQYNIIRSINGVWNLVLACSECNRGQGGKFDSIPKLYLLERLNLRNEFLISSHHPLRETLRLQTGKTLAEREKFLNKAYKEAVHLRVSRWQPKFSFAARF